MINLSMLRQLERRAAPIARSTRRVSESRWFSAVGAVAGGTALIALHGWSFGRWINDDAAITFAYARSVTEGNGLVLQPGQLPVEGFSNPAWLLVLAVGRLAGLLDNGAILGVPDYVAFPKVIGLLCCAGVLAAVHYTLRGVVERPWIVTLLSAGLLAAIPSFVVWTVSGLENPLYALAVAWIAALLARAGYTRRLLSFHVATGVGSLACLAALTRPDGLVFGIAYPLVVLAIVRGRTITRALLAIGVSTASWAVPYAGYVAWRYAEFGQWLPNTAIAKNQAMPSLTDVLRVGELVRYIGTPLVLLFAALIGVVAVRAAPVRRVLAPWLIVLSLGALAYCVLNPEPLGEFRFATPVWATSACVAGVAIVETVCRMNSVRRKVAVVLALAIVAIPSAYSLHRSSREFAAAPVVPLCQIAERYGRVFNGYADVIGLHRGSILLPDVGGTALTSRLRVIDVVGLTNERIAELSGSGNFAGLREYVFTKLKPTFIHSHVPWSTVTGIPADPRLARDYLPIHVDKTGKNGDWVRRDVVANPESLRSLREYAAVTVPRVVQARAESLTGDCGPLLRPGQVPGTQP